MDIELKSINKQAGNSVTACLAPVCQWGGFFERIDAEKEEALPRY